MIIQGSDDTHTQDESERVIKFNSLSAEQTARSI